MNKENNITNHTTPLPQRERQEDRSLITRQQSAAMRGIAILAIMLHNYCHWLPMVQENEYTFTRANYDRLLDVIAWPRHDFLAQMLSFFGHYGVPVFVFLSAYGLVMKYEKSEKQFSESAWEFIKKHYQKLFLMMVVGYTAFVLIDYMTPGHRHYEFWNVIGQLGMFSNFYTDPDHDIWPGPYWYFGLMVQIYIVYRLILYKGKGSLGGLLPGKVYQTMLVILFMTTLAAQLLFEPTGLPLQWYRYNVFGSLPVFIAGLWFARSGRPTSYPKLVGPVVVLLTSFFTLAGSQSFVTWTLVPFCVVAATLYLVYCLPQCIMKPLAWVGSISAAMFVCHPITRKILIPISRQGDLYAGLILYLVATIILAILFKHLIAIVSSKK